MRICFIIGSLRFSGAEKVLEALARRLAEMGHTIDVILTQGEFETTQEDAFRCVSIGATGVRPVRLLRRWQRMRSAVRRISPEVTVSFGHNNNLNAIVALKGNRIPHVASVRTNPTQDFQRGIKGLVGKCIYAMADGLVFQTQTQSDMFRRTCGRLDVVIPNPVIESVPSLAQDMENRKILALGRLRDSDKNFSLLIRAFEQIRHDFPSWSVEIAGEGPDRAKYEHMIRRYSAERQIKLTGTTTNPIRFLKTGSIFVLPSRTEGMPNALIEAMSLGLACIATDSDGGGASSLIRSGTNGILVQNENEEELSEALRDLISDYGSRKRLGTGAFLVNQTLNFDVVGQMWLDFLSRVSRET